MKEVATYMMLVLGGNESPSEADVKTALEAVGAPRRPRGFAPSPAGQAEAAARATVAAPPRAGATGPAAGPRPRPQACA